MIKFTDYLESTAGTFDTLIEDFIWDDIEKEWENFIDVNMDLPLSIRKEEAKEVLGKNLFPYLFGGYIIANEEFSSIEDMEDRHDEWLDGMQNFPFSHRKAIDVRKKINYNIDEFWKILADKSLKSNFLVKQIKGYINEIAEMFVDEY
jgi:hypothetical protein